MNRDASTCRSVTLKPLLLAMAASGLITGMAQAATVTVTHTGDNGTGSTCTLRQAITYLNTAGVGPGDLGNCATASGVFGTNDTVDLHTAGLTGSIQLTRGQITIGVPMTLTGPGATLLSVNGMGDTGGLSTPSGPSRIFAITDGLDTATDSSGVTIERLHMTAGNGMADASDVSSSAGQGGCIYSDSRLTLEESIVSNCQANDVGGGIYVTDNASNNGDPSLSLIRSSITGNTVTCIGGASNGYCHGGGVVAEEVEAKYSLIRDNTVIADNGPYIESLGQVGGGISAKYSVLLATTVSGNTITGTTDIVDSDNNQTNGGLYRLGAGVWSFVHINLDSTISDNSIDENTGTVAGPEYVAGGGTAFLFGGLFQSTVSGNSVPAGSHGAGVAISPIINTKYSIITNSTIANNSGASSLSFTTFVVNQPIQSIPQLSSTIVANTIGGVDVYCEATNCQVDSQSGFDNNLVETSTNILFANTRLTSDPMLGSLADNGGFTTGAPDATAYGTATIRTHALNSGSPAIDRGNSAAGPTLPGDQRSPPGSASPYPRQVGPQVDIGAYEGAITPTAIPTLSEWGIGLLSGLLALFGWRRRPRH